MAQAARKQAEALDTGLLPEGRALQDWLAALEPGSARFNSVSRAAIFLKALQDRPRESFYADLCDALLPDLGKEETVLDLGCGLGNLAMEIADRFHGRVVGLDLDADLLRWGQLAASGAPFAAPVRISASRFAATSLSVSRSGSPGEVRFVCGNLLDPPFDPGTFDLVTLVNVLDSVPYPAVALRQAVALTRPGGHILFASPDSWNVGASPKPRWLATTEPGWDRVFALAELETVLRIDDLEWRLQDSPRLHHIYRVHGRLLQKQAK